MHRIRIFLTAAAVLLPSLASAQAFTFETVTPGSYSSLVQTSGTQTLTVTTVGYPNGVLFAQNPFVALLGSVSIIGSQNATQNIGNWAPMRFSFLNPVASITFAFGDDGGDNDTPARITAYDASNGLLGVFDSPYGPGVVSGATNSLTFGGAGASYFELSSPGGVGNDNSIYWEVTASSEASTVTPEPASLALTATGLAGLFGVVRRRRNAA